MNGYHIVCTNCARTNGICAKCREAREIVKPVVTEEERRLQKEDIRLQLMTMSLREKIKSILRRLNLYKPRDGGVLVANYGMEFIKSE